MDNDSDGDAYDDINMDVKGKPVIPSATKRPLIPLPKGSLTPPAVRPRLPSSPRGRMEPLPKPPPLQKRWTHDVLSSQAPGSAATLPAYGSSRVARSKTLSGSSAPPLPPKPPPCIPNSSFDDLVITPKKRKGPAISDYILDSEELTPDHFVKKYQDDFPLKVRVCKGFYGHSERTSVSEGDTFNVHFVKHTKVVHMVDGGGATYKIALNSALEFGLMYDPNQKRDEALNGFTFEKVSDILAMKVLPKAIRAGAGWRGSSDSSSVEYNELFVVKGLKKRLNSKFLKVLNPTTKKTKNLPENCAGKFSTRPYDVRFFLPEIIEHIPDPLPCTTMLFVHAETASELPSHLVTSVVNLTCTSIETSLIATNTDVDDFTDAPMMDIPLDLDIEFQVLHYKRKEDTEQLYSDTRTLLEHFNPSKLSSYANPNSGNDYSTQSAFTTLIRQENPLSGVDIVKPPTIYANLEEVLGNKTQPSPTKSESIYELEPDSVLSPPTRANTMTVEYEHRLKAVEETLKDYTNFQSTSAQISRSITSARADMKRLEGRTVKTSEDVTGLKAQLSELNATVDNLRAIVSALQGRSTTLQQGTSGYQDMTPTLNNKDGAYYIIPPTSERGSNVSESASPGLSAAGSPLSRSATSIPESVCEQNRLFLASLDYMQVLKLLELMGLKTHQEAFMAERINGEMLLECDDDILQDELKVTSKLRRVRLLKLISGRHSAEQILKGEDPYVYASPT